MRVLIDACLPVQLKEHLGLPGVKTARELGWQNRKNGDLLEAAQPQFDVLLTMDKQIPKQQFLSRYSIGLLIIRARSNRLADILPLIPSMLRMIPVVKNGHAIVVDS